LPNRRYYEKTNRKRAAGVAEDHLTDLRSQSKKRRLAGKEADKVKVKHEASEDNEMSDDAPSSSSSSSSSHATVAAAAAVGSSDGTGAACGGRVKKETQGKKEGSVGPQRDGEGSSRNRVKTEDSDDADVTMSSTGSSALDAIVIE